MSSTVGHCGRSGPRALCLALLVSSASCAVLGLESLRDHAARIEREQCADAPPDLDPLIEKTRVVQVESKYSIHTSGIAKVVATRIVLRPPDGVSVDRLTRALQCHVARIVLRRPGEPPLEVDPYSLPDTWLDIDVSEEHGNYVATISADTVTNNLRVLRNATAFAQVQKGVDNTPRL